VQKNYPRNILLSAALLLWALLGADDLLFGQASTPGGSVRLTLLGGSNVEFMFNSMNDYKSGITYSNWTTLGISVRDEAGDINLPAGDDYTNWQLTFQVLDADGDGFITGTNPANKLLFSTVEVKATIAAGCPTCNVFASPYVALTAALVIIADGSLGGADQIEDVPSAENLTFGTDKINISYRCGFTTKLLGKPADYYSDDIVFTLTMSP
jgi:hypothetical protein